MTDKDKQQELKKKQDGIIKEYPTLIDKYSLEGLHQVADLLGDDLDGLEAILMDEEYYNYKTLLLYLLKDKTKGYFLMYHLHWLL